MNNDKEGESCAEKVAAAAASITALAFLLGFASGVIVMALAT